MNLELKDYYSPDVDEIWSWEPKKSNDVSFLLELSIGEVNSEAADLFQVIIATPKKMEKQHGIILADRATIIVSEFDWNKIIERINEIIMQCESSSWVESTNKLQRYFIWEYENYTEEPQIVED